MILIVHAERGVRRVVDACPQAWAAGIRPGLTLAHARALLPAECAVHEESSDPERNGGALDRLAHWALRFTPLVMADPPDGLRLDIDGCGHLFGGTGHMVELVRRSVERLGFAARVALAPTHGLAWALARFGEGRGSIVVPADRASDRRRALEPMPVGALRVGEATRRGLAEVGIRRVGEVLALPRTQLVDRFGAELLQRIDQALGQAFEPIEPVRPKEAIVRERVFSGPVRSAEGVALATQQLLEQMEAALQSREIGATALHLRFRRADLEPVDEVLTLSRPARDHRHLWSLLRPRVEQVHMGHGIEAIELHAARTACIVHGQQERWTTEVNARAHASALGVLLDTLHARLGPERVRRPQLGAGHLPEHAFTTAPFGTERPQGDGAFVTTAPRPSRLMLRPEPIEVRCLSGAPATMSRRGRERPLVTAIGPERIGSAWWTAGDAPTTEPAATAGITSRAYYRVQDEAGLWWWIYRLDPGGRWYLHGVWG